MKNIVIKHVKNTPLFNYIYITLIYMYVYKIYMYISKKPTTYVKKKIKQKTFKKIEKK